MEQLTIQFDYEALDTETRIVVQQRTTEIKALIRQTAQNVVDTGEKLAEVRELLRHNKGGGFEGWIVQEFGWGKRTAYNFISVYDTLGNRANFARLDVATSALYLLAAPSTPEAARFEALQRAEAGEPITYSSVRQILSERSLDRLERPEPTTPSFSEPIVRTAADYADPYGDDEDLVELERQRTQRQQRMAVTVYSSESNEWYTPEWVTDLARDVMGGIDLDPASNPIANGWVKASAYYTMDDDGYTRQWQGRVWLNPPYGKEEGESQSNTIRWSRKLIAERDAGRVQCGILLVKAALGYNWFEELWYRYPVCFLRERLSFVRPDGSDEGQSKQATALLYFGDDVARFRAVYRPYGRVILPDTEGLDA